MSELRRLCEWLARCPDMPEDLRVDYTDELADRAGVFPLGRQELGVRRNIRGGRVVACQLNFALYRSFAKLEGGAAAAANAEWVLGLQRWVEQESALGTAPLFGNTGGERERIWAEDGRFHSLPGQGVGLYVVQLHARYENRYGG